eukprot:3068-Prymnesium_polylepis.1
MGGSGAGCRGVLGHRYRLWCQHDAWDSYSYVVRADRRARSAISCSYEACPCESWDSRRTMAPRSLPA